MQAYGWSPEWEAALLASGHAGVPGRVIAQHRDGYRVATSSGEITALPSGRMRHDSIDTDLPAVGDWVVLHETRIVEVLPQKSAFDRRAANWLTPGNHNFLRITRILKSLTILGHEDMARAFLECLSTIFDDHRGIIGDRTWDFWRAAIER